MHGIGHTIVLGSLLDTHAVILLDTYKTTKQTNESILYLMYTRVVETSVKVLHVAASQFSSFILDTQDRPLWFLTLFSYGPSMHGLRSNFRAPIIFIGGIPPALHHKQKVRTAKTM